MSLDGKAAEIASWNIWGVEIGLRKGSSWLAILPANQASLEGMLKVMPFHKRRREKLLAQAGESQEAQTTAIQKWEDEIAAKARNILEELTRGSVRQGKDSLIPSDLRFKRTREGNLFVGAGNLLGSIKDAAFFYTGNAGMKRVLGNRLYVSPGKVNIYRRDWFGGRVFVKMANGRMETHVPPTTTFGAFGPQRKPATINFPERVDWPAFLHFYVHIAPGLQTEDIKTYLEAAGELGLMGMRSSRQGQFDVSRFYEPDEATKIRLREHVLIAS